MLLFWLSLETQPVAFCFEEQELTIRALISLRKMAWLWACKLGGGFGWRSESG